jgi:hypothetical protein
MVYCKNFCKYHSVPPVQQLKIVEYGFCSLLLPSFSLIIYQEILFTKILTKGHVQGQPSSLTGLSYCGKGLCLMLHTSYIRITLARTRHIFSLPLQIGHTGLNWLYGQSTDTYVGFWVQLEV